MPKFSEISVMPTKVKHKFLVSFCLTSVLPTLAGIYIGSLFIKYPFVGDAYNLFVISMVVLLGIVLSLLGYEIIKEMMAPISDVATAAKDIAEGKLGRNVELKGAEELEDLSKSLRVISRNTLDLLEKVEKLSQREKITGLYNLKYIRERLNEEISRAILYQQPCSFVYLVINSFDGYVSSRGPEPAGDALKEMAAILSKHLSALDRAGCVAKGEFALIFPDKNKRRTIEIVERIRQQIFQASFMKQKGNEGVSLSISIGISENPIDGVEAQGLIAKAQGRASAARTAGNNAIEAFS